MPSDRSRTSSSTSLSVSLRAAEWAIRWAGFAKLLVGAFGGGPKVVRLGPHRCPVGLTALGFTPYSYDVGVLINQSSADLYLFSTDFPHPEGGRNPLRRFDALGLLAEAPMVAPDANGREISLNTILHLALAFGRLDAAGRLQTASIATRRCVV